MFRGWDADNGGLVYGFAPDGAVYDGDKYFWVQAESFAAAALLAVRTGEAELLGLVRQHLGVRWEHFVDHRHGAWYRILTPQNRRSATRRARPARPTTTPWARATTCCARWASKNPQGPEGAWG
jgi:mannose/cellobiose epimerase-like protein (N-acyl-D-glucosamine 2-epimerase family)